MTTPLDPRFYYPDGTPRPLEEVQQIYLLQIKSQAMSKIYEKYPTWKQDNATSRGVELVHQMATKPLTPEEDAELVAFKAMWAEIKAIRAISDEAEEKMLAMDFEELLAFE